MDVVKIRDGMHELIKEPTDSSLWNKDLDPTDINQRNWHRWNFLALWVALSVSIPVYMLGSGLISSGMNWWQAVVTVLLGNLIVSIPMVLIGHAGTKYGIPFPVFLRSSFGTQGARYAALLRAIVACGWFGILSWIGGNAIYHLVLLVSPGLAHSFYLGKIIGINIAQLGCFFLFLIAQLYIIGHGMEMVRRMTVFASPFLILFGLGLLIWAFFKVGSISNILAASETLVGTHNVSIWKIFWPGLTAIVGYWATLALSIPDFTRFAKSQKEQAIGQLIGLPSAMTLYAFIGIFVTSATVLIFGKEIWDPIALVGHFHSPIVIIISMLGIALATICSNVTANMVSIAVNLSNLWPGKINFRSGGIIAGVIGAVILPWKLVANPYNYFTHWLLAYASLLGSLGGVMLCDYYLLRKTKLNLHAMFQEQDEYSFHKGWNWRAIVALIIGVIPSIPGFLVAISAVSSNAFPQWVTDFYNFAWFISLAISFVLYWLLSTLFPAKR